MGMQSDNEKNPTFFVDAMLGNIAKKLRLMGFDSKYEPNIDDDYLINSAQKDQRVIISRDENLIKKASKFGIESIFLENQEEIKQFHEIINRLGLKSIEINGDKARCPLCNSETNPVEKYDILDKIPTKVSEQNEKFWECKNCGKIFWEGTHITNLQKFVSELNER
jgi:uncharacterized protein with PIN domain